MHAGDLHRSTCRLVHQVQVICLLGLLLAPIQIKAEPAYTAALSNPAAEGWKTHIAVKIGPTDASDGMLFHISLPFDDLAHPDLAQKWIPSDWRRPDQSHHPVSTCQGHWVEIRTDTGYYCQAQWMGCGPGNTDDVEYVFGNKPPKAAFGALISYNTAWNLGSHQTPFSQISWRFIKDDEVRPGPWLRRLEQNIVLVATKEADAAQKHPPEHFREPSPEAADRATYLDAYLAINKAMQFEDRKDIENACKSYSQALGDFESIRTWDYHWNKVLVGARIMDLKRKLSDLSKSKVNSPNVPK